MQFDDDKAASEPTYPTLDERNAEHQRFLAQEAEGLQRSLETSRASGSEAREAVNRMPNATPPKPVKEIISADSILKELEADFEHRRRQREKSIAKIIATSEKSGSGFGRE